MKNFKQIIFAFALTIFAATASFGQEKSTKKVSKSIETTEIKVKGVGCSSDL